MGFYYKTPLTFATIFPLTTTNIFHPKIYCWDKPDDLVKKLRLIPSVRCEEYTI